MIVDTEQRRAPAARLPRPPERAVRAEMKVNVAGDLEAMAALATEWRAIETASPENCQWFQTFDWCLKWMRQHGRETCRPHVLTLTEGSEVIALWPLMVERERFGLRVLRTMSDPHAQYSTILTRNGSLTEAQQDALRRAAFSGRVADTVLLQLVPEGSILSGLLPAEARSDALQTETAMLDLSAFTTPEDYLNSLGPSHRRKRNRRRNAIFKAGDAQFHVFRPGDEAYGRLARTAMEFKQVWLRKTGRLSTGLAMPGHGEYLASLSARDNGDGPLLFALCMKDAPVALEIGFLRNGHYYSYLGSFDWSWASHSPGKVQMEMTVCWLIANGVKTYDLLANPAGYKQTWSNRSVPLSTFVMSHTLRGHMYSQMWLSGARPALKKVYSALPEDVRAGLRLVLEKEAWFIA